MNCWLVGLVWLTVIYLFEGGIDKEGNGKKDRNGNRSTVGGGLGLSKVVLGSRSFGVNLDLQVQSRAGFHDGGGEGSAWLGSNTGLVCQSRRSLEAGKGGNIVDGEKSNKEKGEKTIHFECIGDGRVLVKYRRVEIMR